MVDVTHSQCHLDLEPTQRHETTLVSVLLPCTFTPVLATLVPPLRWLHLCCHTCVGHTSPSLRSFRVLEEGLPEILLWGYSGQWR